LLRKSTLTLAEGSSSGWLVVVVSWVSTAGNSARSVFLYIGEFVEVTGGNIFCVTAGEG
jgi:hypothetical protein